MPKGLEGKEANGGFGWWCESNDAAGFAQLARRIVSQPGAELTAAGQRGFEYMEKHYSISHGYNTYNKELSKMKRLLVISNNVLSYTNNNGKTLLSFIEGLSDIEVYQLFFSGEVPRVEGYDYYRISDRDIISGLLNSSKRGRRITADNNEKTADDFKLRNRIGRNNATLIARDFLWAGKWKSPQLMQWLNCVSPDAILFMAGDTIFAYEITERIQEMFHSRLTVFVTDDYVMPRSHESELHKLRRHIIRKRLKKVLQKSSCFFTISEIMRETYKEQFGVDSCVVMNMADDMKAPFEKKEKEIIFTYTGSFYYGRAEVLHEVALALKQVNDTLGVNSKLLLYSNTKPDDETMRLICQEGVSEYRGSLNKQELIERLNTSDVLVFVESFNEEQIEKVKYSLSTKVPEYMSIGKPILAVGPQNIGSMQYLADIALCVNSISSIYMAVLRLLENDDLYTSLSVIARKKYLKNHNKTLLQNNIRTLVLSIEEKYRENT